MIYFLQKKPVQMKTIIISISFILAAFMVSAQDAPDNSLYVFGKFQKGVVYLNDGDSVMRYMNYNAGTEEVVFEQQGKWMALDNLNLVKRIKIGENVFEPINGKFYQKIGICAEGLYVSYRYKVIPPSAPSAYGSESNTSASTSWSSLAGRGNLYEFTIPSEYKVVKSKDFLLYKDNQLCQVNKYSQVSKLYPQKAKALKDFIKTNKLDWNDKTDIKRIIDFCCGL